MSFQYNPVTGLMDTTVYPTKPTSETAARQQFMDLFNQVGTELNAQKADVVQRGLNATVAPYTADPTGVNDSTATIQTAIDYASANGIKKVILPKGTYKTNAVIYVKSNVELAGEDATITSSVATDYIGSLQFAGSIAATSYALTADLLDAQITLSVTNASVNFAAGDFIFISQDYPVQADPTSDATATDAEHLKKYTSQLLEVASVSGSTITLREPVVHNYYTSLNAKIQKATPVLNATISGITVDHLGTLNVVHSVYFNVCVNCSVNNIKSYNSAGKGVQVYRSRYFNVDGLKVYKRTDTTAGKGYACMVSSSSFGTVTRVYGFSTRHTVDLSDGSHNVSLAHCYGFNIATASFSGHGQNVRKITIDSCHVVGAVIGFQFGDSSFKFDQEIIITNCTATKCSTSGFFYARNTRDSMFVGCIARDCTAGFQFDSAIRCSANGCSAVNCSTDGLLITNSSTDIKITDFSISGTTNQGIEITGSSIGVQLSGISITGALTVFGILINTVTDVDITNLNINVTSAKSLISVQNAASNIRINGFNLKGTTNEYAFEVITSCVDIFMENGSITATVGLDSMRTGTSTGDSTSNINFTNINLVANGSYADKKALRATSVRLNIRNSNITGNILSLATSKTTVIANPKINGVIDIRATTGVIYANNMGTITVVSLGAHDGTNIIRVNNLEAIS